MQCTHKRWGRWSKRTLLMRLRPHGYRLNVAAHRLGASLKSPLPPQSPNQRPCSVVVPRRTLESPSRPKLPDWRRCTRSSFSSKTARESDYLNPQWFFNSARPSTGSLCGSLWLAVWVSTNTQPQTHRHTLDEVHVTLPSRFQVSRTLALHLPLWLEYLTPNALSARYTTEMCVTDTAENPTHAVAGRRPNMQAYLKESRGCVHKGWLTVGMPVCMCIYGPQASMYIYIYKSKYIHT